MTELSRTVSQNADRAREASELASSLTRTAEESGEAMTHATQSMEEITTSSKQISSIVGLIDDIAFQTNLLALNASVEAARAGDAGRGFAVVAVEVRRLAQSAAKASADIKKLIERSNEKVQGGSRFVDVVANKMREMLAGVRASSGLVEQIAGDSQHQAASIGKVSADMRTLEQMTQHNAGLVEETNVAIASTERQVAELDRLIDIFTLRAEEDNALVIPQTRRRRAG
jgi:methyl-accepting chemotaxis protein